MSRPTKQLNSLKPLLTTPTDRAFAHYREGLALLHAGTQKSKDNFFTAAVQQFQLASQQQPDWNAPKFANGLALAHLKQDQAAQQQFKDFLALTPKTSTDRIRAERYVERPELARARMVPAFSITLADETSLTLDNLQGKVVLLDFWATWCGPCKESLPHVRTLAHKFAEEPLVVVGISWDEDEQKWRDFIQQNGMVWAQYRDADHHLSDQFSVKAIPHYFTIDADGVLQDEQVGSNSDIEGRLKKLLAQTKKRQANASISQVSQDSALK